MSDVKTPQLNQVVIAGNCTRDPESITTKSGKTVVKLSIANKRYYSKQGEMSEEICFVDIDWWSEYAAKTISTIRKGSPVVVVGNLKLNTWETPSGDKRSKLSVNAHKVESLCWGNDQSSESAKNITMPKLEDDIPF